MALSLMYTQPCFSSDRHSDSFAPGMYRLPIKWPILSHEYTSTDTGRYTSHVARTPTCK